MEEAAAHQKITQETRGSTDSERDSMEVKMPKTPKVSFNSTICSSISKALATDWHIQDAKIFLG